MPERSGLPSGVLGVGPSIFILPSAVLGAPLGKFGHWAAKGETVEMKAANMQNALSSIFMFF